MLSISISLLLLGLSVCNGFYLPGVAPYDFKRGETVDLKVNKLRYHMHCSSGISEQLAHSLFFYKFGAYASPV
jgi:hypothetical protein